jgi:hypothetical protein
MWQVLSVVGKVPVNDQAPEARAKSEVLLVDVKVNQNRISIP